MTANDILLIRHANQQLSHTRFTSPSDIVAWFGAIQAQDFSGAKWAVGQRLPKATDQTLEEAFIKGEILRTHVMRPTWHFVHPDDIRWMVQLTGPRVKSFMGYYNRMYDLTDEVFKKTTQIICKAFEKDDFLTRPKIEEALTKNKIALRDNKLSHIVMQAELDGLICSGPKRGGQFTYALLEKRAPKVKKLSKDEALEELTKRYFQSHGPAAVKDFAWWSGLTVAEVKKGIEMNKPKLALEKIEGIEYWWYPTSYPPSLSNIVYLLPNYDEYGIAYKERSAFYNPDYARLLTNKGAALFPHMIVAKGQIIGLWRRSYKKNTVIIQPKFFQKPTDKEYLSFKQATERFGKFLDLTAVII